MSRADSTGAPAHSWVDRRSASPRQSSGRARPPAGVEQRFDIVVASDLTIAGDIDLRIAQEAFSYSRLGYRVGLLHLPSRWSALELGAETQNCLRHQAASPVDPSAAARSKLLLIHSPQVISSPPVYLASFKAEQTLVVQSSLPGSDIQAKNWLFDIIFGNVTWVPTDTQIRQALETGCPTIRIEPLDWLPIGDGKAVVRSSRDGVTVGSLCIEGDDVCPELLRKSAGYRQWAFGASAASSGFEVWFDPELVSVRRFLSKIDVLAYLPGARPLELPDATIVLAMAMGKAVVATPELRRRYGQGPLYSERASVRNTLERMASSPGDLAGAQSASIRNASENYSEELHLATIRRLIGAPLRRRRRTSSPADTVGKLRMVVVTPEEEGSNQVQRGLSLARKLHEYVDVNFVTTARAVDAIDACGYPVEYIPSLRCAEADPTAWDIWFSFDLQAVLQAVSPRLLVFVGNGPTPGVLRAARRACDCQLAWVRQQGALCAESAHLAFYFDIVIESCQLEAPAPRDMPVALEIIPPIRLVGEEELLTRKKAAAALGLDPAKTAALLCLDPSKRASSFPILEMLQAELERFPELQVVLFQQEPRNLLSDMWPNTKTVYGSAIGQYFRAFDFSIGPADHDTLNEAISHELPTIFVADDPASERRALYAEDNGAGLCLTQDKLHFLPHMIAALMNGAARRHIQMNCRRIKLDDGASKAARALLGVAQL